MFYNLRGFGTLHFDDCKDLIEFLIRKVALVDLFGLQFGRPKFFIIFIYGFFGEGVNATLEILLVGLGQTMMLQNLGTNIIVDFLARGQTCLLFDSFIFKIGVDVQFSATNSQAFEDFLQALDSPRICLNLLLPQNLVGLLSSNLNLLIILRLFDFLRFRKLELLVDKHDIL